MKINCCRSRLIIDDSYKIGEHMVTGCMKNADRQSLESIVSNLADLLVVQLYQAILNSPTDFADHLTKYRSVLPIV